MVESHRRGGSLFGPLILIVLGLIFLLNNLGLLSWDIWSFLWKLWPIFLIAAGLDILIGRRSRFLSLLIALAVLVVVVFALLAAVVTMPAGSVFRTGAVTTETISEPLNGATSAEVTLSPGVATLILASSSDPNRLVDGTVALGSGEQLQRDLHNAGQTLVYSLGTRNSVVWPAISRSRDDRLWNLRLAPGVPMKLKVDTGVGSSTLDLSGLNITDLDLNTGVGKTIVTTPSRGRVTGKVSGGIGETTVIIPPAMAARIHVDTGLGQTNVSGNFQHQGDEYVSPNYDSAQNRLDLRMNGGVGGISITQGQGGGQ